jgi:hypothetical protein
MLAARVEPKNGPKKTAQMLKVPPEDLIQGGEPSSADLDQNTISSTTSKRQSGRAFAHDHDPWNQ